ncbi:hypothetical protein TIFTF001_030779 [Ficus carica]|uniref:Uncharacterized protein n=1 Tax=Ficus carica TaxID=3494 RepID=A0AA88DTR4_FICCA|nr:hypothetical protein TIFTF001_030779 [Ficus carica]
MASTSTGAHVLVYPYPSSGHIIPLLDLTRRLLTRGLTVTLLVTPTDLPLLQPLTSAHSPPSLQTLAIPTPDFPLSTPNRLIVGIKTMREHHEPALIQWFQSHGSSVVAIVSDFFLGWTRDLAERVGVKRIVFSPSGACGQSLSFALWRDLPKINGGDKPDDVDSPVEFPGLPNSPIYPWWQIPQLYRNGEEGDAIWEFYRGVNLANIASWGFVFNSYSKLEGIYLDHVKKVVGHDRVWAAGPLLPDRRDTSDRGGPNSMPRHEIMTWLDSRNDDSVVYVCFGSRVTLTSVQAEVLTTALEQSGVHFVLSVRVSDDQVRNVIRNGYEERVSDKGLVIRGWAPQVAILGHRAVGTFLTHCGWNSVMEGLSAGIVMLTWPMASDQFTNAKLVVDHLGAGIRVGEGTRVIPEPDELARVLVGSLEPSGLERVRAKEMSDAAKEAVEGGSSEKDLDELVKSLMS